MSSDNFYLIRRSGTRYAVSMEFASGSDDDLITSALGYPCPIDDGRISWFDTLEEAIQYASSKYSEYGLSISIDEDAAGDTWNARLTKVGQKLSERFELACSSNGDGSITLDFGRATVTVTAESFDDLWELASWIQATCPEAVAERAHSESVAPVL